MASFGLDILVALGMAVSPERVAAVDGGFRNLDVTQVEQQRLTFAVRAKRSRRVLYRLVCGSGADDISPEDFSGLIQCKLHPASGPGASDNLFGLERRTSGRSWDNRGRFLDKEVAMCSGAGVGSDSNVRLPLVQPLAPGQRRESGPRRKSDSVQLLGRDSTVRQPRAAAKARAGAELVRKAGSMSALRASAVRDTLMDGRPL